MAHIKKSALTKLEIIRVASELFLSQGYSKTTAKAICDKLGMSTGNMTFYFPTKEHLLAELVKIMCDYQWELMEREADEGVSSIMAVCLELAGIIVSCEMDEIARDFYVSSYTSPMTLELIRSNDAKRAREVFGEYCAGWSDEDYFAAETLVSGIEYATLMTTESSAPLERRIRGTLNAVLSIYGIPDDIKKRKIEKVLALDYRGLAKRVIDGFVDYVNETNEQTFAKLLKE